MKIIHCADIHLDSKLNANLDSAKSRERRAEILQTFLRMVDYGSQEGVTAILISGDLFDKNQVSATARNAVVQTVVAHPEITFFYLQGNHDASSFLHGLESVPENLKLFSDSWRSYRLPGEEGVVISGVELNTKNKDLVYQSLVLDADVCNIVMMHGQESRYQAKDKTEIISLSQLKNKCIDYLALGHIHTYKKEKLDARGEYCYCGCLEGRGFDECGEHGFVMLDIQDKKVTSTFVPFAARQLYEVSADVSSCMDSLEAANVCRNKLQEASHPSSSLIKLILTGNRDVESEINLDFLQKTFENEYYFIKVTDHTRLAVDYDSYALDESLKGEFIRLIRSSKDMDDEMKGKVIACGIKMLAGEEV